MLVLAKLCFYGYRVSDASGELEVKQVGSFPLKMELLDTKVRKTLQISRILIS